MNKVQETLVGWKAHEKVESGQDQKQAPNQWAFTTLLRSAKRELADERLNVRGLIFIPSQAENTDRASLSQ